VDFGSERKATIDFYSLLGDPKDKTNTFTKLSDSSICIKDNKKDDTYDFQCIRLFIDDNLFLFGMPKGSNTEDKLWLYSMTLN
jgi:hypothetical protein